MEQLDPDRCAWARCRADSTLRACGIPLCDVHWSKASGQITRARSLYDVLRDVLPAKVRAHLVPPPTRSLPRKRLLT